MIVFDCEGCGGEIHDLSHEKPPESGFCFSCHTLNDIREGITLDEFWALYEKLSKFPTTRSSGAKGDADSA